MTDSMSVRVRVLGEEFTVPCAEGDQNIKWLSIAAVRLYSALHDHGFGVRQRERLAVKSEEETGMMLPHSVKQIGSQSSLDPEDTINTTLEDGELVEIVVKKNIKIGRAGIPEPSEFHTKAFLTSAIIQRRLNERLDKEEKALLEATERERQQKEEAEARIFGSIDEETKRAFQVEFQKIVDKGFVVEDDVEDLKETLARYFEEVDSTFKHFSGFYVGEPNVMSYSSFVHTVHKTRMLDVTKDLAAVKKVVHDAHIDMDKSVYPDGALTRGNFSELLVRMAIFKSEDDQPVADAFDAVMQEYILPFLDVCRLTDIQQTLESQDTQDISRMNFARLQRLFCRYVGTQSKSSQKYSPGTLTLAELKQLLRDAGSIPKRQGARGAGKGGAGKGKAGAAANAGAPAEEEAFARTAFQKAQKDSGTQADLVELNELAFPEFVETLMWFGMLYHCARNDYMDPKHMSLAKRTEAFDNIVNEVISTPSQSQLSASLSAGNAAHHKKGK